MWFKGTEPESIKTGKVVSKSASTAYEEACARALTALKDLAALSTDPDVKALCETDAADLAFFLNEEKKRTAPPAQSRVAEIDIHTGPEKGGTPNMGARSLLDEDAKEDIKDNKGGYKRIGRFSSPLFLSKKTTSASPK